MSALGFAESFEVESKEISVESDITEELMPEELDGFAIAKQENRLFLLCK